MDEIPKLFGCRENLTVIVRLVVVGGVEGAGVVIIEDFTHLNHSLPFVIYFMNETKLLL